MEKSQKSKVKSQVLREAGFSLVEVLVVIAIMSIMMGVVLMTNNDSGAQKDVEASAQQVAAQLRALQNESLNGKMIENNAICAFKLEILPFPSSYVVKYYKDCALSNIVKTMPVVSLKRVEMTIDTADGVIFTSPHSASAPKKITIKSTKNAAIKKTVELGSNGDIKIN